jgi:squalene-hopene/tetraprenyl-beta-curcumene cyclase
MDKRWSNDPAQLKTRLQAAWQQASAVLLSLRTEEGIWAGELSASALSTATAIVALDLVQKNAPAPDARLTHCIDGGLNWLCSHQNGDGGLGDTIQNHSNVSTTTLVWAALTGPGKATARPGVVANAETWLRLHAGGLEPGQIAATILARYGRDRTFSAPILTHCALTGRLGPGREAWREVIPLPFELAACPPAWFGALRLPVVSYALPALIAIGYARHHHAPSANPLVRFTRSLVTERTLRVLESIQPSNGGFLEATPLTSFVVMSLAGSGKADHPVVQRGLEFLLSSAQPDGSWKIDTNLSTFVSTLATHALTTSHDELLAPKEQLKIQDWLLRQQYRGRHPYTNATPGGWAWTPLPGGVPDADDTAGALVALHAFGNSGDAMTSAAAQAVTWLLDLQNGDGGIPTFCRGWGKLPFDRSSADITAHALRAWSLWESRIPEPLTSRVRSAKRRAIKYLCDTQEPEGSWAPLWFGNQFVPDELNRVYGTSRVLLALADTGSAPEQLDKGLNWLMRVQRPDGGWSGGPCPGPASNEETGVALEALCASWQRRPDLRSKLESSICGGLGYVLNRVADASWIQPAPIGFYFAKLWYYEKLYPVIFTVAALSRARTCAAEGLLR